MFARDFSSFTLRPSLHVQKIPLSPIIPAHASDSPVTLIIPAHTRHPGVGVVRRPPATIPKSLPTEPLSSFPASLTQKKGGTPPGHTNPRGQPPPVLYLLNLLYFLHLQSSPFTAHSQSCYRAFTHPSPCLVTIKSSQGTNPYTMPIALIRPTVHCYRCPPPGETTS
jgi:hypothetical protein